MNCSTFENLPYEIFEIICSFLHPFDIGKLEQASRNILATIQELNVWKKFAVTLLQHSEVPAVQDVLKFMKIHEVTSAKFFKIIIGKTEVTMKMMDEFGGSMNDDEATTYIRNHVSSPRPRDIGLLYTLVNMYLDEEDTDYENLLDYVSSDEVNEVAVNEVAVKEAEVDKGEADAGEVDVGTVDVGEVDAGEADLDDVAVDPGEVDAGEADSGEVDAGEADSGEVDDGEIVEGEVANAHEGRSVDVILDMKKALVRWLLCKYNTALKNSLRNEEWKLSLDVMKDINKYKSEIEWSLDLLVSLL